MASYQAIVLKRYSASKYPCDHFLHVSSSDPYELEEHGIDPTRIWFIFCRVTGSPNEEQTARDYLRRARINVLDPVLAELPSIRQAHNGGKAASEVSFPVIRERAMALAVAVAEKVMGGAATSTAPTGEKGEAA